MLFLTPDDFMSWTVFGLFLSLSFLPSDWLFWKACAREDSVRVWLGFSSWPRVFVFPPSASLTQWYTMHIQPCFPVVNRLPLGHTVSLCGSSFAQRLWILTSAPASYAQYRKVLCLCTRQAVLFASEKHPLSFRSLLLWGLLSVPLNHVSAHSWSFSQLSANFIVLGSTCLPILPKLEFRVSVSCSSLLMNNF